jgi:hypothetical protein
MSDAKKVIVVNDRATAKALASKLGVKWSDRGRPPLTALWYALTDKGFEIQGTYLPKPKPKAAPVPAGKREYEIARTVDGKDEVTRVSIKELRAILNAEGMKGSLGDSRIREAAQKLRDAQKLFVGWEDGDIAQAKITPVAAPVVDQPDESALAALDAVLAPAEDKPAAKAPSKPRAPRNSRAKGKDTDKAASAPEKAAEPAKA